MDNPFVILDPINKYELFNYILFHCYAIKKDGDDGARYILLRKKDKVFYD